MWKCPNCQTVNSNGVFCRNCGTKVPNLSNTPSNTKYILISVFAASAIIIAVFAFILGLSINSKNNNNKTPDNLNTQQTNSQQQVQNPPSLKGVYYTYHNDDYNFYCAYPASFSETTPSGANCVKAFKSPDNRATMTLRACRNPGITAKQAYDEFLASYKGSAEYEALGNSWYAFSGISGNKATYRKLFMKNDCIYCMDFEMYAEDVENYRADIEYIEDNFKAN